MVPGERGDFWRIGGRIGGGGSMGRSRSATRINLLTAKQVLSARDGDFTDGGGLLLRTAGGHASWVFR